MKIRSLKIDGFGRLSQRTITFGDGLNVIVGPNEAGKSTLAAAITASLYGLSRAHKERWRPWNDGPYATALGYETADGARWEVHRQFDKDAKGVRVFDGNGADAASRVGDGRSLSPGEAHLQIPLEVFLQTACIRQQAVAIDGAAAGAVSGALARALSGGPREDAAIGALERLEDAIREHVGTQRAHKNAPLKQLREREERERRTSEEARAGLASLADLRARIASARLAHDRDVAAAVELERRARSLRAAHLRARLAALKEYRDELAALQTARGAFDDVADLDAGRLGALDDAYHSWRAAESVAEPAARDVAEERLGDAELAELTARRHDVGALDDDAFHALRAAAAQAEAARARAGAASHEAAAARRAGDAGRAPAGAFVAAALGAALGDIGVAIAHAWLWTALAGVVAVVLGVVASARAGAHATRRREADAKQRIADAALAEERLASGTVGRVLERVGIASVDELVRRRERLVALTAREQSASKAETRARMSRDSADEHAARFDAIADALVPASGGTRADRRAAAQQRAARRRERDGLDASLAMLTLRRGDILQGDDDFALQAEYDALLASGVEPAADDDPQTLRALERERNELDLRAREAERHIAHVEGELQAAEDNVPDVAALDESLAATRTEIGQLDAFARAVQLAHATIERHKDEAHRAFARRLEEYSAGVLGAITGNRYGEIFLDPATLEIRVRVPETGLIEDLDRLSAGTRDQVALVVRFATARMFAEGLETPPMLLDDPFAFWDEDRIRCCLPILERAARDAQIVVFTASDALARAATEAGGMRIDLLPAVVAPA